MSNELYQEAVDDLHYYTQVLEVLKGYREELNDKEVIIGVSDFLKKWVSDLILNAINVFSEPNQKIHELSNAMKQLTDIGFIYQSDKDKLMKLINEVEEKTLKKMEDAEERIERYKPKSSICTVS